MNIKDIFSNIEKTEQLPVIFAGSGITKRYTTSKYNWKELLVKCISEYADNPENKYKQYETIVTYRLNQEESTNKFSINEAIGTEIERDFNVAFYEDKIQGLDVPQNENPLKFYIANLLSQYSLNESKKEEIELLQSLQSKMLTIVTTNYDSFFEDYIFTKHERIIGQDIFSKSEIGTLFKIHGCTSQPSSIVITQKDYADFKRKRRILSAKLISLFTENPVIFIGYSLHDENIKDILTDIFICIDNNEELLAELGKRLIMVNYDETIEEIEIGSHSLYIDESIMINMTKITLSDYKNLLTEMQSLTRKVKFKELKLIEDLVYEVVHSKEGARTKIVNMTDEDVDDNEVILALTKKHHMLSEFGIIGITRDRLFDDLIYDDLFNFEESNNEVPLKLLFDEQLKNLLSKNVSLPIHKYLSMIEDKTSLILNTRMKELIEKDVSDHFNRNIRDNKYVFDSQDFKSFNEILEADLTPYRRNNFLILYAAEKANPEEIRDLLKNYRDLIVNVSGGETNFRKLACIFDIRMYKAPNEDSAS